MAEGNGFVNQSSDSEGEDKEEVKKGMFRVDDWLQFTVDPEVMNLLSALYINTCIQVHVVFFSFTCNT